ncbi:MAG: hypothetical protein H6577_09895 [Lewinellaceae bacterium]|nr:hypothetical protein [Saprospiraceae bacterium]MCB9338428.1 hypothetical protein [Lewinellaceae bacterium]
MTDEQKIVKGFNAGYLMARHRPELSQTIQKGLDNKEDSYVVGFIAGAKEYEREVSKPRTRNYKAPHLPQGPKSPDKGKGKDMDNREV